MKPSVALALAACAYCVAGSGIPTGHPWKQSISSVSSVHKAKKPKGNVVVAKSGKERQRKPLKVLVLDGDIRQRRLKNATGSRKAPKIRRAVKKASPLTPAGWWKRPQEVGSRFVG
jgi:Mrp family chromosome partitioning ATPase